MQKVTRIFAVFFVVGMMTACTMPVQESKRQVDAGHPTALNPYYEEAVYAAKKGHVDKAISLFETVTQGTPDFILAYTHLGLQYLQKNDLEQAEQAFIKAISLDVTNFVAYNHRGVIMRQRGDFTAAKAMYQTAIKYNPDYANAHINIAILYDIYLYDLEQALYHYKKYQSLSSDSDELVGKWIVDVQRQIAANNKGGE